MTTTLVLHLQQSNNKYNIQQTNYLLQIPKDTINIINSYLFYDKITGETRKNMKKILKSFENACMTRVNPHLDEEFDENSEHWAICMADIGDLENSNETQFQANNCKKCGGYKYISGNYEIPFRARCHCYL
jgi:hypothetical protein